MTHPQEKPILEEMLMVSGPNGSVSVESYQSSASTDLTIAFESAERWHDARNLKKLLDDPT